MPKRTVWLEDVCQIDGIGEKTINQPAWRRRVGQLTGFTLMKPKLPLVMDLNTLGQMAQLNEQKRLRKELEEQNEIARRTARASQPASIPHDPDKAGKCCACNNIVSFEALTCPDCGQPDPSQHARGTAPSEEFERDHRQANFIYKPPSPDDVGGIEPSAEAGFEQDDVTNEAVIRKSLVGFGESPTGELTKADLEKVTRLDLSDNQLTDVPKDLEKLTQLTHLYLKNNKLTDVKGLEKLTQLTDLYLNGNQLTDVKGLEKLTQLTWLVLSVNLLTDVRGLENLTQLTYLGFHNNPDLTKAQIAELQKALPKCKINSDPTK